MAESIEALSEHPTQMWEVGEAQEAKVGVPKINPLTSP